MVDSGVTPEDVWLGFYTDLPFHGGVRSPVRSGGYYGQREVPVLGICSALETQVWTGIHYNG